MDFTSISSVGAGPCRYEPKLACPVIIPLERITASRRAADRTVIDDVWVFRMDGDVAAFTGAGQIAVCPCDSCVVAPAGDADTAIVLLCAVYPIRGLIIDIHPIKLRRRLVVDRRPSDTTVVGDIGTPVVPLNHPLVVIWIDPDIMVIPMWSTNTLERTTSIDRSHGWRIHYPNDISILRIGKDLHVVP